jgi:hypothetical protein
MATATAMANGNGNNNGGRQWQGQWLTAMAMAMAMATEMAMAITMATAMANGNGNGNGDSNRDGNSNHNGNGHGNDDNDVVLKTTDTREGCLFMHWQCAALWQGRRLASPPWTQRSVHCPALRHGGATAKDCLLLHFRGRDSDSSPWIGLFIFYNYCSVY